MKKKDFRNAIVEIVLDSAKKGISSYLDKGATHKITVKNGSCYVVFHQYEKELQFLVFKDGNVIIRFHEPVNGEKEFSYYVYDEADDHDALLKVAKKDIKLLLSDYFNKDIDYHILTDQMYGDDVPHIVLKRDTIEWVDWYKEIAKIAKTC